MSLKSIVWTITLAITFSCGVTAPANCENFHSLGMGLNGVNYWSGAQPFLDLMKQSGEWQSWTGSKDAEFELDDDGWVTRLKDNQRAALPFYKVQKGYEPAYRRYVVVYEGEGKVRYTVAARLIKNLSRNKDLIELGDGLNALEIMSTNPKNYIRNIKIVPEEEFDNYNSGEIFNPKWLEVIRPFGVYRFMDWLKTNNSTITHWKQRPMVSHRTWAQYGVPLEVIAQLSQKMQVGVWVNLPHLSNQEYLTSTAQLLDKLLPNGAPLIVEYSNEVWNSQFEQAKFAREEERKLPHVEPGSNGMQWYGTRVATMCHVFKSTITSRPLFCVAAVHTAVKGREKFALDCPQYKKEFPVGCAKNVDWLAITTYFTGGLSGYDAQSDAQKELIKKWASDSGRGVDSAFEQLSDGRHFRQFAPWKGFKGVKSEQAEQLEYWKKAADSRGMQIVAYEGGQHLVAGAKLLADGNILPFYERINRDKRMGELYSNNLQIWRELGGALNMHYMELAVPSKHGDFGARNDYSDRSSPKWEALRAFSQNTSCWWLNCKNVVDAQLSLDLSKDSTVK